MTANDASDRISAFTGVISHDMGRAGRAVDDVRRTVANVIAVVARDRGRRAARLFQNFGSATGACTSLPVYPA